MQSTSSSDCKNMTVVLSTLTDNNKKRILPCELDRLQRGKNAADTINT